jgi:hypothetical protein
LVPEYYSNLPTFAGMLAVVAVTCVVSSVVSLFCSVSFQKSYVSLTAAYLALGCLYLLPPAADYFAGTFLPDTPAASAVHTVAAASPVSAVFALPLDVNETGGLEPRARKITRPGDWPLLAGYFAVQTILVLLLLALIGRMFRNRYDAAG